MLVEVTEKNVKIVEPGKFASSIFVELQKALDTFNHELLLKKLEHCGLGG